MRKVSFHATMRSERKGEALVELIALVVPGLDLRFALFFWLHVLAIAHLILLQVFRKRLCHRGEF